MLEDKKWILSGSGVGSYLIQIVLFSSTSGFSRFCGFFVRYILESFCIIFPLNGHYFFTVPIGVHTFFSFFFQAPPPPELPKSCSAYLPEVVTPTDDSASVQVSMASGHFLASLCVGSLFQVEATKAYPYFSSAGIAAGRFQPPTGLCVCVSACHYHML